MNTLTNLTAERLIKTLPKDCIDELFGSYLKEQVYDLTTFVETKTPPEGGWFLVFLHYELNEIFTSVMLNVPIYAVKYINKADATIKAYWLPGNGLNQMMYLKDSYYLSESGKIYITPLVPDKKYEVIWTFYDACRKTNNRINKLEDIDVPEPTNVTYLVPPEYQ